MAEKVKSSDKEKVKSSSSKEKREKKDAGKDEDKEKTHKLSLRGLYFQRSQNQIKNAIWKGICWSFAGVPHVFCFKAGRGDGVNVDATLR